MIQVCSQCGTRWNVRDRQRSWCPRCRGALLAPAASQAAPSGARPAAPVAPPKLAPGFRWIAVRPGAPPRRARGRRPLGPTPRYQTIPSWGLHQYFDEQPPQADTDGPQAGTVRFLLIAAAVTLGVAAVVHLLRYVLLLINRGVLLHPVIAVGAVLLGLLASLAAIGVVVLAVVAAVRWLIHRRAVGYAEHGDADPRSRVALWLGCLIPGVNVVLAPVFVWELAALEGRLSHLRRTIVLWWIVWALSAAVTVWSLVSLVYTSFFSYTPQNIADNTVTTIVGYLLAVAAFLLTAKVFTGFDGGTATEQGGSIRRWVVVASEESETVADSAESADAVESRGQDPAA